MTAHAGKIAEADVFATMGVRPVVNCCGVYTDLGGSILSPTVWTAVEQLNTAYVRMPDLLDEAGRMIANLVGAEAARVTPGASAAIALAVGATMTGDIGERWEQLPDTSGMSSEVVIAASHLADYKYATCARMAGARFVAAGPYDRFDLDALIAAVTPRTACLFVPAHLLDGFEGTARLAGVAAAAHRVGVPLVVDAAYMVYPTSLLREYHEAGADLVCFSAKYFGGPNSGGFVAGRAELVKAVEGLDFTRFESGRYRSFGRAFKMSRYDVAATALALREWLQLDHDERWRSYNRKLGVIERRLRGCAGVTAEQRHYTMSEELINSATPNALVLRFPADGHRKVKELAGRLETGTPIVAAVAEPDCLVVAVDALQDGEENLVAERLALALEDLLK